MINKLINKIVVYIVSYYIILDMTKTLRYLNVDPFLMAAPFLPLSTSCNAQALAVPTQL